MSRHRKMISKHPNFRSADLARNKFVRDNPIDPKDPARGEKSGSSVQVRRVADGFRVVERIRVQKHKKEE